MMKTLPDETAYSTEEFQIRIGELILVLRDAPTRSIVPWPKVGPETHDETWIRSIKADMVTESAALRIVWKPEGDMGILRTAGSYLCKAINEGSVDKALFWIKWLLEEDAIVRKLQKGASLSTIERGPAGLSSRQRTRLLLARALVLKPRLLLLDDVFDGMDKASMDTLTAMLLSRDLPWTVIIATRDPLVASRCDHSVDLDSPACHTPAK
jgi:ABC-type dipeptide/oligopeptide/nickel transport system ATPase component